MEVKNFRFKDKDGKVLYEFPITGVAPDITITASVDNNVGIPSVTVTKSGENDTPTYNLDFKNLKGDTGPQGNTSIYRGKYLGTSVTAEQYAAISSGTFEDLYIGDYWTIGGVNYRIAAFDYYWNCGDNATPPHHAVIVPEKNLYNAVMNTTNTTTGGYVGSQMYTANLAQAKATIKAAFSGHVINHRIYLVNSMTNGYSSGGAWCDSEVDLMNEQMVYGSGIFSPVSTGGAVPANYKVEKNQLPLFAMNPAMLNTRENYWLRDVIIASGFACVAYFGGANCDNASASHGVRPAFCIS